MSWRLPPRCRRWRPEVWPEPQGIGAAPQKRAKAADIAGVGDQGGGDLVAGAEQVGDRVAVLFEQGGDLGVEIADALAERVDVAGELADDAGGDGVGERVAEADAPEPAQLALTLAAHRLRLGDRIDLLPR